MTPFIGYAAGALALLAAIHFGSRFYAPGDGYEQERRDKRISRILTCTGLALIVATFLFDHLG